MGKVSKADKKIAYDSKLCQLLDDYNQVLIAAADNVGSNQLQNIRQGLRGDSVILMGKNTMMKRSIRMHSEKTGNKAYLNLIPLLVVSYYSSFLSLSDCSVLVNNEFRLILCVIWFGYLGKCWFDLYQG